MSEAALHPDAFTRQKFKKLHRYTIQECTELSAGRLEPSEYPHLQLVKRLSGCQQQLWVQCPTCPRLTGALYVPPNATQGDYRCRVCHSLVYSSQRHKTTRHPLRQILTYRSMASRTRQERRDVNTRANVLDAPSAALVTDQETGVVMDHSYGDRRYPRRCVCCWRPLKVYIKPRHASHINRRRDWKTMYSDGMAICGSVVCRKLLDWDSRRPKWKNNTARQVTHRFIGTRWFGVGLFADYLLWWGNKTNLNQREEELQLWKTQWTERHPGFGTSYLTKST